MVIIPSGKHYLFRIRGSPISPDRGKGPAGAIRRLIPVIYPAFIRSIRMPEKSGFICGAPAGVGFEEGRSHTC